MIRSFTKIFLILCICILSTGLQELNASVSDSEPSVVTQSEGQAGNIENTSPPGQDNLSNAGIENTERERQIERYTRWFIIITLILSLLTVILAFSKLFSQRKANRRLAHQRNILKQTLVDLKTSEEKYKALFSKANDAIFLMDHGTFQDCNDKTLEMFGCKREEIIGQPPYKFSPRTQPDGKNSKEKALHMIEQCYQGKPQRFYWMHSKMDGTLFDAEVSLNVVRIENSPYIQAIVRNISERVRAEKEMIRAREKAEKATESKTFFLAKMSHEIRTMLGGITSSAQLLMNTKVNKHQSELLDIIDTSADNLLSIVNEILDFSKIEAGKIDLEEHPFNIRKTLEGIIKAYLAGAREKDISLYLSIHHNIPEYVSGDELRLKQILSNLLSNAIKFTDTGSVTLDVIITTEDKKSYTIAFKISDTGIGIPDHKIKDLFAEYSQSDVSISRRFGGTGLGLNIVYKLVNLMDGSIEVTSKLTEGTQFLIQISFHKTDFVEEADSGVKAVSFKNLKKHSILLAEDNEINQKITIINLQQLGHDIDLAENGIEAWEKYKKKEYDIILMDIQMPEMDGIEVTHLIRDYEAENPSRQRTRIIALTANILGQDAEYCLSEGMDAYIAKPFRIEDILEKIHPNEQAE
ncbi:MAG: response regulator [Bacteroidales bacterium]|nr:response regulator [Bacteroidales bacterium]